MKTLETTAFFVEVIIVMLAVIKWKKQLSEGNLKKGIYQDSCTDRHIRIEYLKNTEMWRRQMYTTHRFW